jgi:energy-coupling factor transporter transmembrane protein EcfT
VLLLVVVVAIPLGLFLLLALALLYTLGYVAGAHLVGRRLVNPPGSRYVAFLVGWLILRGIGLIPFLGGLVWVVASIGGLGALVIAARRSTSVPATPLPMSPIPEPPPAA